MLWSFGPTACRLSRICNAVGQQTCGRPRAGAGTIMAISSGRRNGFDLLSRSPQPGREPASRVASCISLPFPPPNPTLFVRTRPKACAIDVAARLAGKPFARASAACRISRSRRRSASERVRDFHQPVRFTPMRFLSCVQTLCEAADVISRSLTFGGWGHAVGFLWSMFNPQRISKPGRATITSVLFTH